MRALNATCGLAGHARTAGPELAWLDLKRYNKEDRPARTMAGGAVAGGLFPPRPPFSAWSFAVTHLDQLRLRLTDHDFDWLMQAAKLIQVSDRDAFLKDVAAELGQHEVVGPGLLHRVISEVQPRYIATKEPATG